MKGIPVRHPCESIIGAGSLDDSDKQEADQESNRETKEKHQKKWTKRQCSSYWAGTKFSPSFLHTERGRPYRENGADIE